MINKLKECSGCGKLKHIWKSEKKEKFCKECWYNIKKPKNISSFSKKMKKTIDEYSKIRIAFLVVNPYCKAKLQGCTRIATDVHHSEGRGENHLKISTWIPLCRTCHSFVELHPSIAKTLNLSKSRLNKNND